MKADGIVLEPVRAILRVESLLLLGLLIAFYWWMHANWIVFVILLLAPDIAIGNAREKLTPFRYWEIDPQGATLGRYPSFSRAAGGP